MLEDAVYQGMQTPGHKYSINKADKLVYPRAPYVVMIANTKKKTDKIKKSDEPDVGTYSPQISYRRT